MFNNPQQCQQPSKTMHVKEAKIVKLNRIHPSSSSSNSYQTLTRYQSNLSNASFDSTASSRSTLSSSSLLSPHEAASFNRDKDVSGEFLTTQLYVLKDYNSKLNYGDLRVKRGDLVYLVCELSEAYYLVENAIGLQGFVPKELCINLEETIKSAQDKFLPIQNCKITSL
jgi:hypothetical protein